MAITVNAINTTGPLAAQLGATVWQANGTTADASGCEELVAAPGAGYQLCVTRLIVHLGAAITVTIGSGETGPGSVENDKLGPLGGAAGTYVVDVRDRPIALTANKSLTVDASGAGVVCVYAEGFTRTA